MRAGTAEQVLASSARAKLERRSSGILPDPEERAWLEPRLAQLLGLSEEGSSDQDDLFFAWRLFSSGSPRSHRHARLRRPAAGRRRAARLHRAPARAVPKSSSSWSRWRGPSWGDAADVGQLRRHPPPRSRCSRCLPRRWTISFAAGSRATGGAAAADPRRAEGVPLYAVETVRTPPTGSSWRARGRSTRPPERSSRPTFRNRSTCSSQRAWTTFPDCAAGARGRCCAGKMFTKAGLAALGEDSDDELSSVLEPPSETTSSRSRPFRARRSVASTGSSRR